MSGFEPNYNSIVDFTQFILSIFTNIWSSLFAPVLDDFYMSTAGGYYQPTWSYFIPVIAIGLCFVSVALAKKLVLLLIERCKQ